MSTGLSTLLGKPTEYCYRRNEGDAMKAELRLRSQFRANDTALAVRLVGRGRTPKRSFTRLRIVAPGNRWSPTEEVYVGARFLVGGADAIPSIYFKRCNSIDAPRWVRSWEGGGWKAETRKRRFEGGRAGRGHDVSCPYQEGIWKRKRPPSEGRLYRGEIRGE